MTYSPVFIFCAASSGSTLLASILHAHSKIFIGPELYLLNKQEIYNFTCFKANAHIWLKEGLIDNGQIGMPVFYFNRKHYLPDYKFLEIIKRSSSTREFFDCFFHNVISKHNKCIWGEKTGSNSYCTKNILKIYPNATIIHLVRDPRDSCISIKKRSGSFYHAAAHWLYNNAAARACKDLENYHLVRYEDLVSDPKTCITLICKRIGVEFEPAMLNRDSNIQWRIFFDNNTHKSWSLMPDVTISAEAIGKGRSLLTNADKGILYRSKLTNRGMKLLGIDNRISLVELAADFNYNLDYNSQIVDYKAYMDALNQFLTRCKRSAIRKKLYLPLVTIL